MYNAKTIGKKMQKFRKAAGLQQTDVSSKLGIPVNRLSTCENGHTNFTIKELIELCELYGTTPNDVLGFEMDPASKSVLNKISNLNANEKQFIGKIVDSYVELSDMERKLDFEMEME